MVMKYVFVSLVSFLPWVIAIIYIDNLQWGMTWNNENTLFAILLSAIPLVFSILLIRKRKYLFASMVSIILLINVFIVVHDIRGSGLGKSSKADVEYLEMKRYFTQGVFGEM